MDQRSKGLVENGLNGDPCKGWITVQTDQRSTLSQQRPMQKRVTLPKDVTILPDWLKPGAIAYHQPSNILFVAERLTSNGSEYRLYDAPAHLPGTAYPLAECRRPTLQHLTHGCIIIRGQAISVRLERNLAILWNDSSRYTVQLQDEVDRAAQSLATFFRGHVIQGNTDEILQLLPGGNRHAHEP